MSKIFDALSKTKGDIAAFALPLIDSAGAVGITTTSQVDVEPPSYYPGTPKTTELKSLRADEAHSERVDRVVFHTHPTGSAADRFRILRMHLREFWTAGKLRSILVTSPLPGDGKSTIALNLATALVEERNRTVLLIDADLHRGRLNEELGLDPHSGLTECLQHGLNPLSAIQRVEPFGWYLLSSGKLRANTPTELLQPQEVSSLIQRLSRQFDWIVIDSPPVLGLSDAIALRHHADASLLVAKAGVTPAKAVEDSIALLGRKHVMGLVLNGIGKIDQPYT